MTQSLPGSAAFPARRGATGGQNRPSAPAAGPAGVRGPGQARRHVYRAVCVLVATACALAAIGSSVHGGRTVFLLIDIPMMFLCLWAYRELGSPSSVRRLEPLAVGTLTAHLLLSDLVDLIAPRSPGTLPETTGGPVLLLVCVLCCLTMAPRAAVCWMTAVWFADGLLAWFGPGRSSGAGAQAAQLGRELMGLGVIVLLALLNRYHSVARQSLAANRDLRALVHTDELTGLPNRRAMYSHLALRDGGLTLAMVDLDHFKRVNDTAGHDRGDEVLRDVAAVLDEQVGAEGVVGRWGGEEFVVVVDAPSLGRANLLAERLRAAVASAPHLAGVTLSIGVTDQRPAESVPSVLARADELMYEAKRGGRNQVRARA